MEASDESDFLSVRFFRCRCGFDEPFISNCFLQSRVTLVFQALCLFIAHCNIQRQIVEAALPHRLSQHVVLERLWGAKFPAKFPTKVTTKSSNKIGYRNFQRLNFQMAISACKTKVFGKSVRKIHRFLRITFPQTQAPLHEPNLLWVELVKQWCGALAHSTWL